MDLSSEGRESIKHLALALKIMGLQESTIILPQANTKPPPSKRKYILERR